MLRKGLWWKIPLVLTGTAIGAVALVAAVIACVLYVPSVRQRAVDKALVIARDQTGMDIDAGKLYLSPFHHSPLVLYRAYKGEADLPLQIEIDSLFVGHRGEDTLVYTQRLRLSASLQSSGRPSPFSDITSIPIAVEQLLLDTTTFHSNSLIAAVGIDVVLQHLEVSSPGLVIAEGQYPLHDLLLHDADIAIGLRDTPPDTTTHDNEPMQMAFDVPDGEMRNIRFRLQPLDMDIRAKALNTNVLADVGANRYDVQRIDIGGLTFSLGQLSIPADTIYGGALVDLQRNIIISDGLHVRSDQIGAQADLSATRMNLNSMQVDVTGDARYKGSQARLRASYDIDDEAYDATVHIDRVNMTPFLKDSTPVVLAGDIEASGRGINPKRPLQSRVSVRLDEAKYGPYNLSHTSVDLATDSVTSLSVAAPKLHAESHSPMPRVVSANTARCVDFSSTLNFHFPLSVFRLILCSV